QASWSPTVGPDTIAASPIKTGRAESVTPRSLVSLKEVAVERLENHPRPRDIEPMHKTFHAVAEDLPGPIWRQQFHAIWPEARAWYRKEGLAARPTIAEGRTALERYMPEMVAIYDRLCHLVGDDEIAHRALSGLSPPAVISGCSQTAWLGAGGPALLRNYD